MNPSRSRRVFRQSRGRLTAALATTLAIAAASVAACTATTGTGTPTSGPPAGQVSSSSPSDGIPPAGGSAATAPGSRASAQDVAHQVDLMVSPGGRYDELLRAVLVSVDGELI